MNRIGHSEKLDSPTFESSNICTPSISHQASMCRDLVREFANDAKGTSYELTMA